MKLCELRKIIKEASDNAEIKLENGEIVITEPKPIEYKFNVGDKVASSVNPDTVYTITKQFVEDGKPMYVLKDNQGESWSNEEWLELVHQDITEMKKMNAKEIFSSIYGILDDLVYDFEGSPEEQHGINVAIREIEELEKRMSSDDNHTEV